MTQKMRKRRLRAQYLRSGASLGVQRAQMASSPCRMKHILVFGSAHALLLAACNGSQGTTPATTTPASARQRPLATAAPVVARSAPGAAAEAPVAAAAQTWTFDEDPVNSAPAGFSFGRTGSGRQGRWEVRADVAAPSGKHVLAQLDADDTDFRFPVAVANTPLLRDGRISVRCKVVSGGVDQACGLVARYRDENNYFVSRANALENNVRLYAVQGGQRRQLASWSGRVTPNEWHRYRLDVRGDHLRVYWDGRKVIDHHDSSFKEAGRLGVWTKADSVSYFDDLRAEPL